MAYEERRKLVNKDQIIQTEKDNKPKPRRKKWWLLLLVLLPFLISTWIFGWRDFARDLVVALNWSVPLWAVPPWRALREIWAAFGPMVYGPRAVEWCAYSLMAYIYSAPYWLLFAIIVKVEKRWKSRFSPAIAATITLIGLVVVTLVLLTVGTGVAAFVGSMIYVAVCAVRGVPPA